MDPQTAPASCLHEERVISGEMKIHLINASSSLFSQGESVSISVLLLQSLCAVHANADENRMLKQGLASEHRVPCPVSHIITTNIPYSKSV